MDSEKWPRLVHAVFLQLAAEDVGHPTGLRQLALGKDALRVVTLRLQASVAN